MKPRAHKYFGHRPWTFQQDTAPSQSARAIQQWLKNEVSRCISIAQWPPKSADGNPLDYCAGGILESMVDTKKYQSVDQWDKIPQSHFRAACGGFIGRLKVIIHTKGGQCEQI